MKRNILLAMFIICAVSALAYAATATLNNDGEIDGVYTCTTSINGGAAFTSYISVNGHADGSEELIVAAESNTQQLWGYGNGAIDGDTFSGTNSHSKPFSLTVDVSDADSDNMYDGLKLTGTFGMPSGKTATLDCVTL